MPFLLPGIPCARRQLLLANEYFHQPFILAVLSDGGILTTCSFTHLTQNLQSRPKNQGNLPAFCVSKGWGSSLKCQLHSITSALLKLVLSLLLACTLQLGWAPFSSCSLFLFWFLRFPCSCLSCLHRGPPANGF